MSLHARCHRILENGDLDDKLTSVLGVDDDTIPGAAAVIIPVPTRAGPLTVNGRKPTRLPRMHMLSSPSARIACLHRFADHELMAIELFAWALLAYPDAPAGLRRGFALALDEEQQHLRLYLSRLQAHGAGLGDEPMSDSFWQHLPNPQVGALAFLCMLGLTLEQANLDFTLQYRDAFREAGDEESARVLQRVHDDEIGHVKLAATWAKKLTGKDDVDAYLEGVPFPLSAARAKGRRFDVAARAKAGLSAAFTEHVKNAQLYAD